MFFFYFHMTRWRSRTKRKLRPFAPESVVLCIFL
nr:MAG TPA: hypothetical protein [Caudoviricetes sp.]DAZ46004.1 MAG TPA: hypothetical protein [Caudoviricetes sp.]